MKISPIKKAMALSLCSITVLFSSLGITYGTFTHKAKEYIKNNPSFNQTKVVQQVDYWGGDLRYIDSNYNDWLMTTSPLSTHFYVGDRPIQVGYSKNVPENKKAEFDKTFDYFNKIFEVINPKYKFITNYNSKANCDIFLEFAILDDKVGAQVKTKPDDINPSKLESAHIWMNSTYMDNNTTLRFYLAHEMMHVLMGAHDVNEYQSQTFSVFNSGDVGFLCSKIDSAKIPTRPEQVNTQNYLTQEQKDSYITLLPTDVSTLIAIYGNPTAENSEKYLQLLTDTYQSCKNFFGDQPYYKKGYSLPKQEDLGR